MKSVRPGPGIDSGSDVDSEASRQSVRPVAASTVHMEERLDIPN